MPINLPPPSYLSDLQIRIFADGANLADVRRLSDDSIIKGFTTNPTLIRKSAATDYLAFARELLSIVPSLPVSLEVVADDSHNILRQAVTLAALGDNVFVKVPVKDVSGKIQLPLIKELSSMGIPLNVTAITTVRQVAQVASELDRHVPAILSVFAGRIADSGQDAKQIMVQSKTCLKDTPRVQLLWASVREPYNLVEAEQCGCDIVTVPIHILDRARASFGASMEEEAARIACQFSKDAREAGYSF